MPEIIKPGRYFDFMKMRAFWLVVSLGLTFGSLLLIVFKGPNYGTDFKGGTEVELAFRKPVSAGGLRAAAHRRERPERPPRLQGRHRGRVGVQKARLGGGFARGRARVGLRPPRRGR